MSSAAKVGIFMVIILVIAGYLILRIEDVHFGGPPQKTVVAVFNSAAGLDEKSPVRVAGVREGKVTRIQITPDGRAKVTMQLDTNVPIHQGASAQIASLGLLGEKYVEIDTGNPSAPLLQGNEEQPIVLSGSQPPSIDQVTAQVSAIASDVKAITESLRNTMAGQAGQQRLEDIVENVRASTAEVREMLQANRENVNVTAENIRQITSDLREAIPRLAASIQSVADNIGGTLGENRSDVHEIVGNLRKLSGQLTVTAANLNDITGQVKSGEGTVGKLLYDQAAYDKLNGALTAVESGVNELKETLGRANRLALNIGIRSDYYAGLDTGDTPFNGNSRSSLQLDIIPNPERNRFYHVELADDPNGVKREKINEYTVTLPDGTEQTYSVLDTRYERDFLLSAQAGWRLDDFNLRLGLFDNTGGVGADYRMGKRISLSGEVFDFGKRRNDNAHLRLFGNYVIRKESKEFPMVYVSAGVDDVFNDRAFTVGGGIRWEDQDLKYLLGSVPIK
ncbi:MAG: MlaD family protein [Thermoanaerobaculia bacterium]